MKKCWLSELFLDSGARAEEMLHAHVKALHAGVKALARGIVAHKQFLEFCPHWLENSPVSWHKFLIFVWKNADSANCFSIAGLGLNKCCMWTWRHLPGALLPRSSFWCFPPLARKFTGFMTPVFDFFMKKCWLNESFLHSGARAEEMLHVDMKALARSIVAQE